MSKTNETLKKFMPEFGGETTLDGERFLRLQNVSSAFRYPYVMDCKIGTRTFVEKEANVTKPREDLYKRAAAHYYELLTEEEKANKFITKYRWMSIHDECSTTRQLGFRVDGVAGKRRVEKSVLNKLRTRTHVVDFLTEEFIPRITESSFRPAMTRRLIGQTLANKLREFRKTLEESLVMQRFEVIGSSLLVVADGDGRCGINLIDFAKTKPLPPNVKIDHRTPWVPGNHEDGILFGVDNLVSIFDEVRERTSEACARASSSEGLVDGRAGGGISWLRTLFCTPFRKCESEDELVLDDGEIHTDESPEQNNKLEPPPELVQSGLSTFSPGSRNTIGIPADGVHPTKSPNVTIVGKFRHAGKTIQQRYMSAVTDKKTEEDTCEFDRSHSRYTLGTTNTLATWDGDIPPEEEEEEEEANPTAKAIGSNNSPRAKRGPTQTTVVTLTPVTSGTLMEDRPSDLSHLRGLHASVDGRETQASTSKRVSIDSQPQVAEFDRDA
eukprot:GEMP01013387.1.p1 GENE.GEMP01013387.1~~GEMP01013387.1.p1  ORF type:complete len:553 (+),score=103.60 GEMP01013387.1:169-1659(+)